MLRRVPLVGFLLISILATTALAQDAGESGIIYGKDHAYKLTAPTGWVLDNKSGVSQGVYAVFYPKGSSWANGAAVMYTNVGSKAQKQTIGDFIQGDTDVFKAASPNIKITSAGPVVIEKGKNALVRLFSGDTNGNFEAVAYIDEPKVVVMVVLTSRTKKDFDSALPAFNVLLKSYRFISSDVVIEK